MPDDELENGDDEPTQETEKGYRIPIPTKGAFDKLLGRVARGAGTNGQDHKQGDESAD